MRESVLAAIVAVALVCCIACQRKPESKGVKTVEIDGVQTVLNPAEPLSESCIWDFREDMALSNRDAAPDTSFSDVADLAVGRGGELYVLDRMTHRIHVFDARGEFMGSLAPKGEGPGELLQASSVSVDGRGDVYVLDGMLRRISVYAGDGNLLRTVDVTAGSAIDVRVDSLGRIYLGLVKFYPDEMGKQDLRVVRVDTAGAIVVDFGTFPLIRIKPIRRGDALHFTMTGYEPAGRWAVRSDGTVAYGYGDDYEISLCSADGKLVRRIRRAWTPEPVTAEEKARVLERYSDEEIRARVPVPNRKPAFSDLLFDDMGNLWVRVSGTADEHVYDVFDPQGRLVCRVQMPARVLSFANGAAYVLAHETDGSVTIKRLRRVAVARQS